MSTFHKVRRSEARAMRLLHEIRLSEQVLRVERAPSGLNHYFVAGREVAVSVYLETAGREFAKQQLRIVGAA